MADDFKRTPLGRHLNNRPEVLTPVVNKLATGFVDSYWKISHDPYMQNRFESYINQNFPWFGMFVAARKCQAPLRLSFATLSSKSYRKHLANGLAELGLQSVRSLLQQRQSSKASGSKPNQETPAREGVINQAPQLKPLASDHEGKFPKFVGQKVGQALAAQYVEFISRLDYSQGGLAIYDLLEDAEKDLKASAVKQYVPTDTWNTLAANGGLGEYVFELREAALDVILHSLAEVEGRRFKARTNAFKGQSGASKGYAESAKSLSAVEKLKPPSPLLHVDPTSFEQYCAEWSIYLGYGDAKVTRAARDGGYDIAASRMIAQCKFQELPVGVKPIRELHGVATLQGKQALFFSLNGYSRDAVTEAGQFKMQLWTVHPLKGKLLRVGLTSEQMNEDDYHSAQLGNNSTSKYPN